MASTSHVAMPHLLFTDKWKKKPVSLNSSLLLLFLQNKYCDIKNKTCYKENKEIKLYIVIPNMFLKCKFSKTNAGFLIMVFSSKDRKRNSESEKNLPVVFFKGLNITRTWQLL